MNLISVIVPIYNQEKYLDKSIKSLLQQKYSNLEIILVNDGSTDNSIEIIRDYEKRDKRIQVVDKMNGGVSSARNAGLKIATGEYIGFIDPDDWIDPDMYGSMYNNLIINEAELTICNYIIEKNNKKEEIIINTNEYKLRDSKIINFLVADMINMDTLNISTPSIMGSAWRLLIKRNLIYENNIRFDEDTSYMEDLLFVIEVLINSKTVGIDNNSHYHYNQLEDSASNKYLPNFFESHYEVFKKIKNILIKYDYISILEDRLKYRYVFIVMHSIRNEARIKNDKSLEKKINYIRSILEDRTLVKYIKDINYRSYTKQRKMILYNMENSNPKTLYSYYKLTNILRNYNII